FTQTLFIRQQIRRRASHFVTVTNHATGPLREQCLGSLKLIAMERTEQHRNARRGGLPKILTATSFEKAATDEGQRAVAVEQPQVAQRIEQQNRDATGLRRPRF